METEPIQFPEDHAFPFRSDGAGGALVFRWKRFKWEPLIGRPDGKGYFTFGWRPKAEAYDTHKAQLDKVHRIMWRLYKGPIPAGLEIDHIDGNKANNHIDNLQLVTHAENMRLARQRLGNWAKRKLQPHQVALTIAMPSNANWRFWADRWGVHKVRLLNIRSEFKKKSA